MANEQKLELGISGQYGNFNDGQNSIGDRKNLAVHAVYNNGPWEIQGQFATYDYNMDIANEGIVIGAYAYYDTIPESADSFTANVAYHLPDSFGPITNLTFNNNYSLVTNKKGLHDDTIMNVTGVAISAGGMFTYVDLVNAKNQPFINGSIGQDGGSTEQRFNINFGFYF